VILSGVQELVYPNGDILTYDEYLEEVLKLTVNPGLNPKKKGWIHVPSDRLAIKPNGKVVTAVEMEEHLQAERERLKRYRKSPHGKQKQGEYQQIRNLEKHRENQRRYSKSDKGKATISAYQRRTQRVSVAVPDPESADQGSMSTSFESLLKYNHQNLVVSENEMKSGIKECASVMKDGMKECAKAIRDTYKEGATAIKDGTKDYLKISLVANNEAFSTLVNSTKETSSHPPTEQME
jgi:hypothetical protein